MAYKTKLKIDPIRSLPFGSITASYNPVGPILTEPARILIFNNLTDHDLFFSIDGITDQFIVPTNSFKLIDITTNRVRDDGFFLGEGNFIFVKHIGIAPTLGSVYVEIIYA